MRFALTFIVITRPLSSVAFVTPEKTSVPNVISEVETMRMLSSTHVVVNVSLLPTALLSDKAIRAAHPEVRHLFVEAQSIAAQADQAGAGGH